LPGDIGYIQAYYLRNAELNFAMESLADTRGFILDLRGYPRFVGVQNLISKFLSVPGGGRSDWPIAFLTSGGRVVTGSTIRKGVRGPAPGAYRKPLVVLIDSSMVSAAEHIAMSLRNAKRGVLVGNTTKGTNGNITRLFLPGGGWIRFTGMRMKFADGAPFQNIGVVPDVWVDETLGGLIAGDDEILERGLEVLRAKLASE
jgi:C-terminal processing protease CtpA/Prc